MGPDRTWRFVKNPLKTCTQFPSCISRSALFFSFNSGSFDYFSRGVSYLPPSLSGQDSLSSSVERRWFQVTALSQSPNHTFQEKINGVSPFSPVLYSIPCVSHCTILSKTNFHEKPRPLQNVPHSLKGTFFPSFLHKIHELVQVEFFYQTCLFQTLKGFFLFYPPHTPRKTFLL